MESTEPARLIRILDEFACALTASRDVADRRMVLIDAWRELGYSPEEIERMLAAFNA